MDPILLSKIKKVDADRLSDKEETTTELALKATSVYVDIKFGSMGSTKTYKGSCLFANLPASEMMVDDYWYISDQATNRCWNGSVWGDIGNSLIIGDKTITPKQSSFAKVGKNMVDTLDPIFVGKLIVTDGSIGVFNVNTQVNTSKPVKLTIGKTYTVSNNAPIHVYLTFATTDIVTPGGGITGFVSQFVTNITNTGNAERTYTFVADAEYMYVSYFNDTSTTNSILTVQVEFGALKTVWEKYQLVFNVANFPIKELDDIPVKDFSIFDLAYIKNNELVLENSYVGTTGLIAKYTGIDLGENPTSVMCKAKMRTNASVTLIATPNHTNAIADITNRAIHISYASFGYYLGFAENGVITNVKTGGYAVDDTGVTEYEMGWSVDGDIITLYLPDGTTTTFTDARVSTCNGRFIIWEHYLSESSVTNDDRPSFTYLYAKGLTLPALVDSFKRFDGAIGIAPSGHVYYQYRNVVAGD